MRKLIVVLAVGCIGTGLYFGLIHKPSKSERVRILPGIEFVFTRDENAADYYAKAFKTMSRRAEDDRNINSLTADERKWFMLGTSCRQSSWYPEHYPHVVDPWYAVPQLQYLRGLGRIMASEGRAAEEQGDVKKAMDIWTRVAVLGWQTETEQECVLQVFVGAAIEMIAYNEFIRHYRERGDTERARRYEGFKERLRKRLEDFRQLTRLASAADYRRITDIAFSHKSPMWRREACMGLAYYCANVDGSARQDGAATLRKVSRQDRDPAVRETARNMIPYVLGQKTLPPVEPEGRSPR